MGYTFKRFYLAMMLVVVSPILLAKAIIDADVLQKFKYPKGSKQATLSLLVFLHNQVEKESFIEEIKKFRM